MLLIVGRCVSSGGTWFLLSDSPEADRTPFTPLGRTCSSLDLKASSWSVVMRAEAAN